MTLRISIEPGFPQLAKMLKLTYRVNKTIKSAAFFVRCSHYKYDGYGWRFQFQTLEYYIAPMYRTAIIIVLAMALTACASTNDFNCKGSEHLAIHDTLYFGTTKPNGVILLEEWAEFLKGTVTPRFPQGFTVWQASGQWRSDGFIVRESSHVLTLVHPDDEFSEKAVLEIVGTYKSKFQQESVLRVRSHACASF
jgi:hypothetical protein